MHDAEPAAGKPPGPPRAALAAAIALGTFAVFARAGGAGFIHFDDNRYLFQNPIVQGGLSWASVQWAFTTFHASNWHPLAWLSHLLDVQLFGMAPGPHHLVNVALHAASAALLFLWLARATGSTWRSAFAAALFALHPLRVESVAWVAERKDVLSTLLGVGALHAWLSFVRAPSLRRYGAVLALFAASLLAKPMWVTLPFALVLLDAWPLARLGTVPRARLVAEKVPLLALSLASCLVTFAAQAAGGTVAGLDLGIAGRLANAAVACAAYLGDLAWPHALAVLYPYPAAGHPGWLVLVAALLLVAATVAALWARRAQPWWLMGWLWFLGTLVPVIGLVQVGAQARADRYTYLPSIGLCIAVAWTAGRVTARWRVPLRAAAAAALLAVLAGATWVQLGYWRDNETLFRRAIAVTRDNALAYGALAEGLRSDGRRDEALQVASQAASLDPTNPRLWNNLGVSLREAGRRDEAHAAFERAIEANPGHAAAWRNLGDLLLDTGDLDGAARCFEQATRFAPRDGEGWARLASLRLRRNEPNAAVAAYEQAVRYAPEHFAAWSNLAVLYQSIGRSAEAGRAFEQAAAIEPDNFVAARNLGVFLAKSGRLPEAISAFRHALRIRPDDADVLHRTGVAHARLGLRADALAFAATLEPLDPAAADDVRQALLAVPP